MSSELKVDTISEKTSWTTYRQELRDLPATVDVSDPVLPTKPS